MSTASLLLEIGVEELPASFVDAALAALPPLVTTRLADARLAHGEVKALGTPRRLAIVVRDLATVQRDLDEEVIGPGEGVAFKDGKPTKAAEAFAAKLGITVDALSVVEKQAAGKQKAGRYVVGRRVEKGRAATELLGKVLADVCAAIPFRKSMRWADLDATFGRPVQWIVALLGDHAIDVSFAGVRSARKSRGHRFLSPAEIAITSADTYVAQLRDAHVIVDRDERASTMMERVAQAAKAAGGVHDPEPMLVDENASLVEEPHVVTGSFEPEFLELPAAVIRAIARGHQRYFCVQKGEDELLAKYLVIANTALAPANVAKGNDRTMRARLADGRFFYEEDKKVPLEQRVEKLAGIVFHNKLGTVREKVARIEKLAAVIAQKLGVSEATLAQVKRAAHLCKFDLVSLMVGEFPELQGHMGRAYARHAGEAGVVADAVRDHYKPVGAADAVATDDVAAIVALADRLDTLTCCFAIGLSPTGAADPYALRRACIAALRTVLDNAERSDTYARLAFGPLIADAYAQYSGAKPLEVSKEDTVAKVTEFALERLRGLVASATSAAVADAILAGEGIAAMNAPCSTMVRARALQAIVDGKEPWLEKAKLVAKRLGGISKEASPKLHAREAFSNAKKDDASIVKLVEDADRKTRELDDVGKVRAALEYTGELATRLDEIFVATLINDPDDLDTPKRLELLSYGAKCMLRIADFSKLA
jgi:glycyl-tRNA synthetase beta chain